MQGKVNEFALGEFSDGRATHERRIKPKQQQIGKRPVNHT